MGNFIKLKALIKRCDTIVIFPGSVSSLNVFRIAYGRNTMPVFYPVVGGWIANKIKRNNKLVKFLKRFKCIYPETKGLADELFKLGIDNCTIIPTFTLRQTMEYDKLISNYTNCKKDHVYKIIYFGRITKSKGIYLALDAIKEINDSQNDYTLTMDYYGQFAKKEDFSSFSASLDDNIRYCGIMPDSEVWKISEYDFFIFPTFYHGEGMPACCIESLVFGTPIIASDWRFNKEIVIDGFND